MPRGLGMRREIRRHVRGRRMFYEFNLSLFAEIFAIVDPLSFLFHWFFSPRCGIAREEQETEQVRDWMIDGFRRIYGYFVPRRERILLQRERFSNKYKYLSVLRYELS